MVMVEKNGQMSLFMKEISRRDRNMDTEFTSGKKTKSMRAPGWRIKFKDTGCTLGLMVVIIQAAGKITRCMDLERISGLMAESTKVFI